MPLLLGAPLSQVLLAHIAPKDMHMLLFFSRRCEPSLCSHYGASESFWAWLVWYSNSDQNGFRRIREYLAL